MKSITFSFLIITFLISCGHDDEDSSSTSAATVVDTALTGTWQSECMEDGQSSIRYKMLFYDTVYLKLTGVSYSDSKCKFSAMERTEILTGVTQTATSIAGFRMELTMTLRDSVYADYFNKQSFYGYQDWKADAAKNIGGRTDDGETEPPIGEKKTVNFKLNADGKLYTSTRYSADIDTDIYFLKVF